MLAKNFFQKFENLHIFAICIFLHNMQILDAYVLQRKALSTGMIYMSFCRADRGLSSDSKTISVAFMVVEKIGF